LVDPNIQKFENIIGNDIVVDMSGCSTPVSELDLEPTSFDYPTQNYIHCHHHHHANQWNGNYAFISLQNRHEIQNY